MIEEVDVGAEPPSGDFVQFRSTGDRVKGEFRCSRCGYGVAVSTTLPACPMCAGTTWEPGDWSPFSRAGRLL
jgi:hypothetical protein